MYDSDDQLIATHLGDDYDSFLGAVVPPVFMNSLHVFPTMEAYIHHDKYKQYIYGRVSNPTVRVAEQKIAAMEHAEHALLFSSGMAAATTAILVACKAGSHIVCLKNCYGPVVTYLEQVCVGKLGMHVSYIAGDVEELEAALRPETDLILLESPTSLVFEVVDLRRIAALARQRGIYTYIDNSYCTPLFQKPLDLGIDFSMHTLSKYIGGHSDLIGGVLCCNGEQLGRRVQDMRELCGGIIGPQEAWLVTRGIRTLDVRLQRHQQTALAVARFLQNHPRVRRVHYPGLPEHPQYALAQAQQKGSSGLLSFELHATKEEAMAVCNRLQLFKIGVSWGGFESLVTMPMYARTPAEAADFGATPGLVRIHCGLEGAENLIDDLKQALA